jgi:hypothetical protein
MTDMQRVDSLSTPQDLQPKDSFRGLLRLGDTDVEVRPTREHGDVPAPVSHGGRSDQIGQQAGAAEASLRDRMVPSWQKRGALAGTLVGAAALGTATGILFGVGKGAAIGALVGSIIPGAGTAVGGVVGGLVGGLVAAGVGAGVGALIGRALAGGSDRSRAEKLIEGLYKEKKITLGEAEDLRGLSNSEVGTLVSISKDEVATKADRDAIRQKVLVTAAKRGPKEAEQLKEKLLNLLKAKQLAAGLVSEKKLTETEAKGLKRVGASELSALVSISEDEIASMAARDDVRRAVLMAAASDPEEGKLLKANLLNLPPDRAALGARNVIALGHYLREKQGVVSGALRDDQDRLRAHWRSMRDKVLEEARNGRAVVWDKRGPGLFKLNELSAKAIEETRAVEPSDEQTEVID